MLPLRSIAIGSAKRSCPTGGVRDRVVGDDGLRAGDWSMRITPPSSPKRVTVDDEDVAVAVERDARGEHEIAAGRNGGLGSGLRD